MKNLHCRGDSNPPERGAALVVTLIVCTVLAMVVVALMQNTGLDRASARSITNQYQAKLAAESGLAEAMALIQSNAAGFGYVSGAEPQGGGYRTYIRRRSVAGGVWQFSGSRVYLDSGTGGELADLLVSGTNAADGVVVRAAYKTASATNNATNRYAFWVDDGSGKQNLSWWGGEAAGRGLLADITNAPLVLPSANGTTVAPMPGTVLSKLNGIRAYTAGTTNLFGQTTPFRSVSNGLLTPATFNLLDSGLQGRANRYFFTLSSPSSAASPAGRRKLNLAQLARYLNSGISSAQGAAGPRAQIVDQLLQANPAQAANWGGGDLNWLATAGKYSTNEQRQIVANLLDYLDDDLIPTTDSIDNPTYFGVEMKADLTGRIMGHPFINFVTAGLIFNRSSSFGFLGQITSTRVIISLGLVYPWPSTSCIAADYTPEVSVAVRGLVRNGIPSYGSDAARYFATSVSDNLEVRPIPLTFEPFRGYNMPSANGMAANTHYATRAYGHSAGDWPSRAPTNVEFSDVVVRITSLRLKHNSGGISYALVMPRDFDVPMLPKTFSPGGGGGGSFFVRFTKDAASAAITNLYLNSDPRAGFLRASWTNLPSVTSFGTNIPAPSAGASAINLTNGVGTEWDEAQGLNADFNWYTSPAATNHFSRFGSTNSTIFPSIGEIGYLWTGKPWQTLNLTRTNNLSTADHNLLDYLAGGSGTAAYSTMPLLALSATGPGVTESNSLLQDGGFNVLTRKLATATAYLTNAPGISGSAAADLTALPPPELPSLGGALAVMTNLSSATTTKFDREGIIRAMANGAVTQSRIFTIYSRGEYVSPGVRSQALLEADVFVDFDPGSGTPVVRVVSKKFL